MSIDRTQLGNLVVEIWRTRKRISAAAESADLQAVIDNAFGRIDAVLEEAIIEIVDHSGKPFSDGMTEEVVFFEKNDSIEPGKRIVNETIKPTIYIGHEIAVIGQIIVAHNDTDNETGEGTNVQ